MFEEWSGTLTLTEKSSKELFRVLKEQDEKFMDAVLDGKCGFTLKSSDGRTVELVPKQKEPTMDIEKLLQIMKHYGPRCQLIKTMEELSELQVELARHLNHIGSMESITNELADVHIMLSQIQAMLFIDQDDLESRIAFKIDRQLKRIQEEETQPDDCPWR